MTDEGGFHLDNFKEVSENVRILRALFRDLQSEIEKIKMRLETIEVKK